MTHRSLLLAGLILLGACAHRGDPALPTCDGTARRPANPHGSVLTPRAEPRPAEAAVDVGPNTGYWKISKLTMSSIMSQTAFSRIASCSMAA
jgi:hypothetical protein